MATSWQPGSLALLAHADLFLLAAEALQPPAMASRPAAADERLLWQAADLARACGLAPADSATLAKVLSLLVDRAADQAADRAPDRAREYTRLFEAGGCCPPNETAYIRRDKGVLLADLCGFYRAFGFTPATASGEKADHIVTELQFVALLLVLAAQATAELAAEPTAGPEAGRAAAAEHREVTLAALAAFGADHLGEWLPSFVARLQTVTTDPLLWHTADLLVAAWRALGRQVSLPTYAAQPIHEPRPEPDTADWPCHPAAPVQQPPPPGPRDGEIPGPACGN
jgi:TorA maturation chaperone TorD